MSVPPVLRTLKERQEILHTHTHTRARARARTEAKRDIRTPKPTDRKREGENSKLEKFNTQG